MTNLWHPLAGRPETRWRAGFQARTAAGRLLCSLGVVAALGASLLPVAATAGADPVSNLQAQAAQLSRQMLLEQLQIGGFQQQRNTALAAVTTDQKELAAIEKQATVTRERIAKDVLVLRHAAVKAYIDGGTQSDGVTTFFASDPTAQKSAVYNQVMTGDLKTATDQLEADREVLHEQMVNEQQVAVQAKHQLAQANTALAAAQSIEQQLASQHASVTDKLAVAIAQQQAQQAAAARAAAAAAATASLAAAAPAGAAPAGAAPAGAAPAGAVPAASPQPSSSSGTPPLPVLPPFLRCVIQAESGGDYQAVSPTGQYMGAFQFAQSTWNVAAQLAGKPTLIGVAPDKASPYDQDLLAIALYNADGEQPWYDPCRN